MSRRKRVQVGWFCDHEHEPYGERSHMSNHGRYRRGKWQESFPEPHTNKALTFLDFHDTKKRPPCPLAEPIYVYREAADA